MKDSGEEKRLRTEPVEDTRCYEERDATGERELEPVRRPLLALWCGNAQGFAVHPVPAVFVCEVHAGEEAVVEQVDQR